MSAKYTPGPWKINKRSWPMTITGHIHQITNNDRLPSAFVPAWDNPQEGEEDGSEEALANAHLIAAAPDLLAALKEAADFVQPFNRAEDLLDKIEAVIAKAEGRS